MSSALDSIRTPWDPPDVLDTSIDFRAVLGLGRCQSEFFRTRAERARHRRIGRRRDAEPSRRLPADYRLAQIDHAIENGFSAWEIAALVPPPVTNEERARVIR